MENTRPVKAIQFGILSPDEIRSMSVCNVIHFESFENKEIKVNGVLDARMGSSQKNQSCATCGENISVCPGHFGHIELARPVFHIGFLTKVKKILECICYKCGRLRLLEDTPKYDKLKSIRNPKQRFKYCWETCKSKAVCEYDDCGHQLFPIRKQNGFQLVLVDTRKHKNNQKINLNPEDVRQVFSRIPDSTCMIMGIRAEVSRPEWMILTVLPVPPPCVRPSVTMDHNGRGEDDLTHKLIEIVRVNNAIKKNEHDNTNRTIADLEKELQISVVTYIDNEVGGVPQALQKGGRPLKSITARLKGKEGRVRNNLMGKRVDFAARTVITGDPNLSISEVGVPLSIAKNLTFPERVTRYSKEKLQCLVDVPFGTYPGARYVIRNKDVPLEETRIDLKYARTKPELQLGDIVERFLIDGDYVVFNRQPSLHKMSMMGHRVKVMPFSTFRLNLSCTTPYNADFDGDEMNLHAVQELTSVAEVQQLSTVARLVVSPQSNKPVMGIVQDALCGARKFTKRDCLIDENQVMKLLLHMPGGMSSNSMPVPCIIKPKRLWSGKQLFSMLLPKMDYHGFHSVHPDEEKEVISPGDTRIVIQNGELLAGIICKRAIGASSGGIIHIIWQDHGTEAITRFMDGCQLLINCWLQDHGFSVGVKDMMTDAFTKQGVKDIVTDAYEKVDKVIDLFHQGELTSVEKENKVNSILNKARDMAGNFAQGQLPAENCVKQMVNAGSKGSKINISQMTACVGQQNVEGKRMPFAFRDRTLPHFSPGEESPQSRGFVESSYIKGLNPTEFFFHAMGGREGVIDTAVKSVTGDTTIIVLENDECKYVKIGEWIDQHLEGNDRIQHFPDQKNMELLEFKHECYIPTADNKGNASWGKLTAVTRHDPSEKLYSVTTKSGRKVTVADSKTLLVYNKVTKEFEPTQSSKVKLGDLVPVVFNLPVPPVTITEVDLLPYFPKTEYIHGTDFLLAVKLTKEAQGDKFVIPRGWWAKTNGTEFTLPYSKKSLLTRVLIRSNISVIKSGQIYSHHFSGGFQDKFPLTRENGVFIGLFLAQGDCDGCSVSISNNDQTVGAFCMEWFKKNNIKCEETLPNRGESHGVRGFSSILARFIQSFLGVGSAGKFMPPVAFVGSEEFSIGILDGYFSGDGCVGNDDVTYSSVSYRLTEGISLLLSRLGIFAKITRIQQKKNNVGSLNVLPTHVLSISDEWATRFAEKIDLVSPCKNKKLKEMKFSNPHPNYSSQHDIVLDEITEIQAIDSNPELKLYDVTVPSTLNFSTSSALTIRDTASTGYLQRRLIKALEDVSVNYDGTVRNSRGDIIEFKYGEDSMDGTSIEKQKLEILFLNDEELKYKFYKIPEEFVQMKKDRDYMRRCLRKYEDYLPLPVNCNRLFNHAKKIPGKKMTVAKTVYKQVKQTVDTLDNPLFQILARTTFCSKRVMNNLTKEGLAWALKELVSKFQKAQVPSGEMVGVLAAQSIGEPATQMTLNSFHYDTEVLLEGGTGLRRVKMGEYIDTFMENEASTLMEHHPNNTKLVWLEENVKISSCDENGNVTWRKVEAVTRHPVINKDGSNTLLLVKLHSGRQVIATKAKSFLVYKDEKCIPTDGSALCVGDHLPVSVNFLQDKVIPDQVVSITEIPNDHPWVYDFTVEGTRNFATCQGIHVRDSFHFAGVSSKNVTLGIPRLSELINVAKNIKTPSMYIYLEDSTNEELAKTFRAKIEHTLFSEICVAHEILHDPDPLNTIISQDKSWTDLFWEIPDIENVEPIHLSDHVLRLELDRQKLWKRHISIESVCDLLESTFERDIHVIHSDSNAETLVIQIRVLKDEPIPDTIPATDELFLRYFYQTISVCLTICGIQGISRAYVTNKTRTIFKENGVTEDINEYLVETDGINMREILKTPGVDRTRLYCNDPLKILECFGIECAKEALLREVKNVIEFDGSYVNARHMMLLCDIMTSKGFLMSMTRHGINRTEAGPLMKCTFEETVEILMEAAVNSEKDNVKGVVENIILGQLGKLGTGIMDVLVDTKALVKNAVVHERQVPAYSNYNPLRPVY